MTFLTIRQLVRIKFSIHQLVRMTFLSVRLLLARTTFRTHDFSDFSDPSACPHDFCDFLIHQLVRMTFSIRQLVRMTFSIRQLVHMTFSIRQLVHMNSAIRPARTHRFL